MCDTRTGAPRFGLGVDRRSGTLEAVELHKLKTSQLEPAAESATTGDDRIVYRPHLTGP